MKLDKKELNRVRNYAFDINEVLRPFTNYDSVNIEGYENGGTLIDRWVDCLDLMVSVKPEEFLMDINAEILADHFNVGSDDAVKAGCIKYLLRIVDTPKALAVIMDEFIRFESETSSRWEVKTAEMKDGACYMTIRFFGINFEAFEILKNDKVIDKE